MPQGTKAQTLVTQVLNKKPSANQTSSELEMPIFFICKGRRTELTTSVYRVRIVRTERADYAKKWASLGDVISGMHILSGCVRVSPECRKGHDRVCTAHTTDLDCFSTKC